MSPVWVEAGRSFVTNALYYGHGRAELSHLPGLIPLWCALCGVCGNIIMHMSLMRSPPQWQGSLLTSIVKPLCGVWLVLRG
jgi:hypothetical protein